ncbi:MAG: ABC transporter substrate-binding protein [Acidimicrobiales bacterium]|jgi:branched-chain amino acid transport system substrate-binding protein
MESTLENGTVPVAGQTRRRHAGLVSVVGVVVLAATLAACSSTNSVTANNSSSTKAAIPKSAFSDRTGLTASTVTVGNVSTLLDGIFKGAAVGTEAYADYVNSTGGVNGRRIIVDSSDDQYAGAPNKDETQEDVGKDFAMVGSFSLFDSFGGVVLKANPQVPNVTVSLDLATAELPNSFSPAPTPNGWILGPLVYFQKKFPDAVKHAGALVADEPSAEVKWTAEKAAMEHLGYKVIADPTFDISTTNFTQYVVNMKNAGVKILFMEQMPENYAASVVQALNQQDFHPVIVFGGSTYSEELVPNSGGAAAIDGAYMEQNTALYLGEDASGLPAVSTFLKWVQTASPGFHADLYTLYGWLSAELFSQALKAAGPDPSRGSELEALRHITSFSGGYLTGPANPAGKVPTNCYIIARIENGKYQRLDDPPLDGPTHGYRCDQPFYYYPA